MRNIVRHRPIISATVVMVCIILISTLSLKARSSFYDDYNFRNTFNPQYDVFLQDTVIVPDTTVMDSVVRQDSIILQDSTIFKNQEIDTLAFLTKQMNENFAPIAGFLMDISDSLRGGMIDSLFKKLADTTSTADSNITAMSKWQRRKHYRDSVKAVKDSIRMAAPRILNTGFIPDSLYFKRILVWNTGSEINEFKKAKLDTTFNDWYTEYPYYYEDVDVNYLGVIGSATQNVNFMKRREFDKFKAFAPYLVYSYTPENMPFYNTKTPYTELGYWGTLLAFKDKEELNIRFLHTQNITPELNLALLVQQYGAAGLLKNERTENKNLHFNLNYLGKKYVLHAGYIQQIVDRNENGGIQDSWMVTDTTVDAKTIDIHLNKANNNLSRNTFFVNHSLDIPLRFKKKNRDSVFFKADSTANAGDGSKKESSDNLAAKAQSFGDKEDGHPADSTAAQDKLGEGPMITVGHIGELSRFYHLYTDEIAQGDNVGREFYSNNFYINPTRSSDSTRLFTIENKFFFKIQPWAKDAVVNQVTGGIGHQWNSFYSFDPDMFLKGNHNIVQNNLYVYAGAGGEFRKYLHWGARGRYYFLGYYLNDFDMDANVDISFYPFKDKMQPMTLSGKFSTSLKEPDLYSKHYYSNHYIWNNDFGKTSTTKVEAMFSIPKWNFELGFGYALVNNYLYNDTLGVVRQNDGLINVMNAYLKQNLKLWFFHFDHRALFQYSSDKNILPLPTLTLHFKYYLEFEAVKNVLTLQLGADATYNTLYYAPSYNPALGTFCLQNKEMIGNNPYIDLFLNLQWKTVSIFFKFINVAQKWPNGDMFSAYHYIKPYRVFKLGIYWPFHY